MVGSTASARLDRARGFAALRVQARAEAPVIRVMARSKTAGLSRHPATGGPVIRRAQGAASSVALAACGPSCQWPCASDMPSLFAAGGTLVARTWGHAQ